jgi:hypothetical protein
MKKINFKLPEALNITLESLEYEEDGGIVIHNIKLDRDDICLTIAVYCGSTDIPIQIWEIRIQAIEKHQITISWAKEFLFYSDHLLLTEYHENYAELYFIGRTNQSDEISIEIYRSLIELGDKKAIAPYVYSPQSLNLLCNQDHGLFARGPKNILEIYATILSNYNLKTSLISEIEASSSNKELKLLIIGESYFVGRDFIFTKL